MATQKQIDKWMAEAQKINDNPEYIREYVRYRQLAKKADQRLVRLEALSYEEHFHGVLELAYKRAIRDIKTWGGDKRFNTAPPTTITEIKAKIADIQEFVEKPTSSKSQIQKIYNKMAATINKKYAREYGMTFTWQELANFYESDAAKRDDVKKASKTVVRALAVIKKMGKEDLQNIKDVNERIERVSDDKVVNNMVKRLTDLGIDYDTLKEG